MLKQFTLIACLWTYVSTQDTSTNQMSQSSFRPDQSSWSSMSDTFDDNINSGSFNLRNLDSSSLLGDFGPFNGQSVGPYTAEPYSIGDDIMGGSSFMDSTIRDPNMMNADSWLDRNSRWSVGGLDSPNPQSSLLSNSAELTGFSTDGSSSVLDGRSLNDDLSGFSRSNPWDMSPGARAMNRFPFQNADLQSMTDRGDRGLPAMSMGRRRGMPWRNSNTWDLQRGMGQFPMPRRGRGHLGMNRWNMPEGELNLMEDLTGDSSMDQSWMSGSRSGNFRNFRSNSRMLPMSMRRLSTLPSSSRVSSLSSGLGQMSALDRTANLRRMTDLSSRLSPTFGRMMSSGRRSSRVYPSSYGSQMEMRRRMSV